MPFDRVVFQRERLIDAYHLTRLRVAQHTKTRPDLHDFDVSKNTTCSRDEII
jgi:hypothetical protein